MDVGVGVGVDVDVDADVDLYVDVNVDVNLDVDVDALAIPIDCHYENVLQLVEYWDHLSVNHGSSNQSNGKIDVKAMA